MEYLSVNGLDLTADRWGLEFTDGWWDTPGSEVESVPRLGHGDFAAQGRWAGRVVVASGLATAKDHAELEWMRNALTAAAPDGGTFPVWGRHTGELIGGDFQLIDRIEFKPDGPVTASWQLSMHSEDAFLHTEWRESTLQPVGAGVGFEFVPFSRGGVITFGSAVDTDEWVWNEGNAPSAPVFTVTADSPGFAVAVGDKRVTYPWPTFMDVPITVDMAGSVLVGGVDQSHLLGERRWGTVPPGEIESVRFEFLNGGTGWATVRHRDTYI